MYRYNVFRLSTLTILLTFTLTLVGTSINAQCHNLIGSDDVATSTPVWYSCNTVDTLNITTSNSWTGLTIDWGDGSATESFVSWLINDEISHIYPEDYGEYSIVFTSIEGCSIVGEFIKQPPLSSNLSGPDHMCQGFPATLTHDETQADNYSWNFNAGVGMWYDGSAPNLNLIFNDAGTYEVYGVVSMDGLPASCSDTARFDVSVTPIPEAIISLSEDEGCGTLITVAEALSVDGVEYEWTFNTSPFSYSGSTTPEIIFENSGMHVIQLEVTGELGCVNNATEVVTVFEIPNVEFSVDSVCEGSVSSFTNLSIPSENETTIDFTWSFGDGEISDEQSPQHTYSSPGEYEVSLEMNTPHCTSMNSHSAIVEALPEMIASSDIATGCSPLTVNFEATSDLNSTITWDFGDDQSSNNSNEEHTYIYENMDPNGTPFVVTATATSPMGCVAVDTLEISALKRAIASIASSGNGCAPLNTIFTNNSENASDYIWNFSDGDLSSDFEPVHIFDNTSENIVSYSVELIAIAENGCNDTTTIVIDAFPEVTMDISLSQNEGCSPFEVVFTNESSENATFEWTFGDGEVSTELNPIHVFYNENTVYDEIFTVELTVTSEYGCSNNATSEIAVLASPVVNFNVTPITQTYPNTTVAIENLSTSGSSNSVLWNFGDGNSSTSENPGEHTYDTWGVFSITLIISNEYCSDDGVETINILSPTTEIDFSGNGEGCPPFTVDFTNLSQNANSYKWHFGDGTTVLSENATHTFNQAGTYDITLEAVSYNGVLLEETHYASVTVFPRAQSDFSLFPTEVFAPGEPIQFYNLSTDADEFVWHFGNGETSSDENPTYEYTNAGNYNVTLTANNEWGCSNTFSYENAVTAKDGRLLVFPTAFTPSLGGGNGGAYDLQAYNNNVFRPLHGGAIDFEVFVFNKYGEQIFYSSDINIGWDGYVDGALAIQDVYAYKAIATLPDGTLVEKAGTVTLISKLL
jgi:PKD repeat protein